MSKVWITRDKAGSGFYCGMFEERKRPVMENDDKYPTSDEDLSVRYFKKKYGFTPRKGSCRQYELSLKEITE